MKAMDVGRLEARLAYEAGADAATVAGAASRETIEGFIDEAHELGIYAFMDTIAVQDPSEVLKGLKLKPDVVIIHRAIDVEERVEFGFEEGLGPMVAVAGGIKPDMVEEALRSGADIIIVGRYITKAEDVGRAVGEFLELLG